ncbi:MAG TPA: AMP-binding protein [Spirochaetota bacterium]|nr:AMP-binding protein [Spirochaetota bacterium]HOM09003.1 AMP-binding protein [Spirochaetota bacterium]HPP48867.1 AMP-binding protein [Spirochaetota bacterium]
MFSLYYTIQDVKFKMRILKGFMHFLIDEAARGTILLNLPSLIKYKKVARDMSWAELLEEKKYKHPNHEFLYFEDKVYTLQQMDEKINRFANYLLSIGGKPGKGLAIMLENSPEFLDAFIATQKIGMYSVPINISLRGDSLVYILNHSDAEYLIIEEHLLPFFEKVKDSIETIHHVIVKSDTLTNYVIPPFHTHVLKNIYSAPSKRPDIHFDDNNICFILYTSGTTGLPKGVVYRYNKSMVRLLSIIAYTFYAKDEIFYTCLPLFHANALLLTFTVALHRCGKLVLAKKFSARRFWNDIYTYNVTTFNTIGAMIPILMKQPVSEIENKHKVRKVLSAACPSDEWEKFEKRFNVTLYEGYGAVDGGGNIILNVGNAPKGSIGKPGPGIEYRIKDDNGNDVPINTPGELVFISKGYKKSIEYYKNEKATNDKQSGKLIHTGDLVKQDKHGYLYFIGRKAEFMRIKGENVSAYEVEQIILKHPAVLEAAVYAVPSELAEDEIMAQISLVDGFKLQEEDVISFLQEHLPKFAIPRYIKITKEFPKTETQRIIKKELQKAGIVEGTYDSVKKQYITKAIIKH